MEMIKVQFGCGGNILPGWNNHDAEVDIRHRLPYEDDSVDLIFCEHCIEHITQHEAIRFLEECRRILKPGGHVRIVFPDIARVARYAGDGYHQFIQQTFGGPGGLRGSLLALAFFHGHQALWDVYTMATAFVAAGFAPDNVLLSGKMHPGFKDAAGHWKVVKEEINEVESAAVEGIK